jgi:hypothetical protein
MVLGGLAQRLIQELDATASLCERFKENHVMDLVAGQPIGPGADDPVQHGLFEPIPQAIQPRPIERGATIAIIPHVQGVLTNGDDFSL